MKRITLCGSTRFKREYEALNKQLTLEGYIVYSVAIFEHADNQQLTDEQKKLLDKVHRAKIDNSDAILVIDVDGYIGESTRNEIEYAEKKGKTVKYLSRFPDLITLCDSVTMSNISENEQRYFRALKCIVEPVKYLRANASIEGASLNGYMTFSLLADPNFYRDIARKALNMEQ